MIPRGLMRTAVAAGAVLAGAVVAASPAAAATQTTTPDYGSAELALPQTPLNAGGFSPKGCDGIPGGAKADTDGWVFSQPVQGATDYGYILGLLDGDKKVVTLGISKDGVTGLELTQGSTNGDAVSGEAKALGSAAAGEDSSPDVKEIAAPDGVAGGLTSTGEAWLQTPAGWQLASGALVYSPAVENAPDKFSLVRVCAPKTEASPTPTPTPTATKAPGTGGGSPSLPVTGSRVAVLTGAGVVLVGIGALLFVVRRRREDTTFVA